MSFYAHDVFGYAAALSVLLSSLAPSLALVRLAALFSNVFFIFYGLLAALLPVLLLHALLLPINLRHVVKGRRVVYVRAERPD